jgi:hypothetical protein
LGHSLSPLEQAVIIYHSKKPLAERHAAWQGIIDSEPDMEVMEWEDRKNRRVLYNSLHQFLREYMRIEKNLHNELMIVGYDIGESSQIYTYATRDVYEEETERYPGIEHDNTPYSDFYEACKAIKNESETEYYGVNFKSRDFYMHKRWVDKKETLSVKVTPDGEVISDWDGTGYVLSESDDDIFMTFDLISIYIPVPFKKGDILSYSDNAPFVLTNDEWKYGLKHRKDGQQFLAHGLIMDSIFNYAANEIGQIHWDFNPAMLDLQFYRDDLSGYHRTLKAISSHMKGKISVNSMINVYDIILGEERLKKLRKGLWQFTAESLELAGLSSEKEINTIDDLVALED